MRILVSTFGAEMQLREPVDLDLPAPRLHALLRTLCATRRTQLARFVHDDLSVAPGCAVLLNGRNICSLGDVEVHDGDELIFTVQVAGG